MATLKSLEGAKKARIEIEKNCIEIHRTNMESLTVNGIETLFIYLFTGLCTGISSAYSGVLLLNSSITREEFIYIIFLLGFFTKLIFRLVNAWHMGFSGLSSLDKYKNLTNGKKKKYENKIKSYQHEGLICKKLYYKYHKDDKYILKDISFKANKGDKIAFVGRSGAGKSTLLSLLAGLYPYQDGIISYDGLVLNDENIKKWKLIIGAVWQDQFIFNGTIRDNMLLAKEDATDDEIYNALEKVGLKDFVEKLTLKLDTHLGEMGSNLSGGERQRVTIARVILRDSDLIILDEISSNLDITNQQKLQELIDKLPKEKICLIATHKLKNIKNCDKIFVIENGEIIDCGTYDSLLKTSKLFKELISSETQEIS